MALPLLRQEVGDIHQRRSQMQIADFSDDLALLSDSKEAQEILTSLEKLAHTVGLIMNANETKTKYMSMNISTDEHETPLGLN